MSEVDSSYRIYGLVQGVGFRPFVADLAAEYGVSGYVRNDGGIVYARFFGDNEAVESILRRLLALKKQNKELPGAVVERVEEIEGSGVSEPVKEGFRIVESTGSREDRLRVLPPDIATCKECERELLDRSNRRYKHPFISCVSCGPRYTIMSKVPYDRERTLMSDFELCDKCAAEYERTGDRRHFAQTVCCKDCGPVLEAYRRVRPEDEAEDGQPGVIRAAVGDEAVKLATEVLKNKGIVAIKDIGGYHFACDAGSVSAVKRLREFKHRDRKPFAVMMRDIAEIRRFADVSSKEERILTGDERPIVLLDALSGEFVPSLSAEVLGASNRIGAMLPCNPLQILLLEKISPLVMTSGNRGGEPIITDDEVMKSYLASGYIDLVLSHDRDIAVGLDDSIVQVSHEIDLVQILRRARGYVPLPIEMGITLSEDTFAAGGDLKATFAYGRDNMAYLSGYFGDLDDARCADARSREADRLKTLLGIEPVKYISDKHPRYVSVNDTKNRAGAATVTTVQHHHAHVLAVMAEHHLRGPVLGLAFDGTGYGDDGKIWGGEFLFCDEARYERVAHLSEIKLLGADEAAKNAAQTSMMYSIACEKAGYLEGDSSISGIIRAAYASDVGTYITTSMGRLYDAVAAMLGIADQNTYEGECAMKLQYAAQSQMWYKPDKRVTEPEQYIKKDGDSYIVDTQKIYATLLKRSKEGTAAEKLALAFHHIIANVSVEICRLIAEDKNIGPAALPIALCGGTMQNMLLVELLAQRLTEAGFRYYINSKVPSGDGGLSLGQLYYLAL